MSTLGFWMGKQAGMITYRIKDMGPEPQRKVKMQDLDHRTSQGEDGEGHGEGARPCGDR